MLILVNVKILVKENAQYRFCNYRRWLCIMKFLTIFIIIIYKSEQKYVANNIENDYIHKMCDKYIKAKLHMQILNNIIYPHDNIFIPNL